MRYYGYRNFKGALATLELAAKSLPNSAEIIATRGLLYRRFGRWQEAFAQFIRATEIDPQDPTSYFHAAGAAVGLRWWNESDAVRERMVKLFPRLARAARLEKATTLRMRGEVEAGNKELEDLNPELRSAFLSHFYRALWKRDYAEMRRLVDEAAKVPELERERWGGEVRLALLANSRIDHDAALATEKRLQEQVKDPSMADNDFLMETLACVKMALGKTAEATRIREEFVEKHPVSEDALANVAALRHLAYGYALAGEHERALNALAALVHVPNGMVFGPLKYDPIFDGLRKDPRFDQILEHAQRPFPRL